MDSYLYVLDYNTPGIYEIKLEKDDNKRTPEEILERYGLKDDECSWMFVDGKKLNLETINKIEK